MSDYYDDRRDDRQEDTRGQGRTPPRGSGRMPPPDQLPDEVDAYGDADYYDDDQQPTAPQRPVRDVTRDAARSGPQATRANTPVERVSRVEREAAPRAAYDRTPRPSRDLYDAPPRIPSRKVDKSGSGLYLPWWSLLIMLMFVGGTAIGAWIIVSEVGGNAAPGGGTPQVIVITATYTIGAPATQTSISGPPTETATLPLPTIAASVTLPPGNFELGITVRVVGTGVGGLNVRPSPSLDTVPKFQAPDGSTFVLKEGPVFASNTEWWRIEDPNDPSITGWGARNFLEPVS